MIINFGGAGAYRLLGTYAMVGKVRSNRTKYVKPLAPPLYK